MIYVLIIILVVGSILSRALLFGGYNWQAYSVVAVMVIVVYFLTKK